jgi:UDP-glucose 4-epimerase
MKQKKRVLVTGGAGFIGRHLLQSFYDKQIYSIVVDNLSNSKRPKLKKIAKNSTARFATFYDVDIRDQKRLEGILHDYNKIDACIHLAAKISIIDSLKNPQETFDVNVNGTRTILDVCTKFGIKSFVFASSSAVYGNARRLPLSETENPQPISPYGESKLLAEQLVSMYSKGIPNAVSLRFFNIYGYGQSPEYAGVITKFAQRLQDGFSPIIYGNGQQTRDFISVEDVVRAIILGAGIEIHHGRDSRKRSISNSSKSNIFNIGTGIPTRIADLANVMKEIFSSKEHGNLHLSILKPKHAPPVKGDIWESYADTTKAQQILGFKYRNELRAGLEQLYGQFSFNSR